MVLKLLFVKRSVDLRMEILGLSIQNRPSHKITSPKKLVVILPHLGKVAILY